MVERKLLLVRDAALFTAGKENAKLEHNLDVLTEYMQRPVDFSVIVFMVNNDKLDERKKIVKAVKSAGTVLAFNPLGAEELLRWVERAVKERGCTAGPGMAEALIANAGTGLQGLSERSISFVCSQAAGVRLMRRQSQVWFTAARNKPYLPWWRTSPICGLIKRWMRCMSCLSNVRSRLRS
jgi:hypothetical protein